jgi:hypothetical protein
MTVYPRPVHRQGISKTISFSAQGRIRAKEAGVEPGRGRQEKVEVSSFKFPAQSISSVDQETIESQAVDDGFARAGEMVATNGTIELVVFNLIREQTKVEINRCGRWTKAKPNRNHRGVRCQNDENPRGLPKKPVILGDFSGSFRTFSHVCCPMDQ